MNSKIECASLFRRGFDPDVSAMPFDDLFANGQTDAGAGEIGLVMKALEDDKYFVKELRIDTDAVVGNRKLPVSVLFLRTDADHWRPVRMIFQRIAQQVLKQLGQLHLVPHDNR